MRTIDSHFIKNIFIINLQNTNICGSSSISRFHHNFIITDELHRFSVRSLKSGNSGISTTRKTIHWIIPRSSCDDNIADSVLLELHNGIYLCCENQIRGFFSFIISFIIFIVLIQCIEIRCCGFPNAICSVIVLFKFFISTLINTRNNIFRFCVYGKCTV